MIIRLVVVVLLINSLSACSTWTHSSLLSYTNDYSLARAVMASVTFPAVFNSMTLFDYTKDKGDSRYMHVFDGGNVDNHGLKSVLRIIDTLHVNKISYDKLVDFVDTNVIEATDSLLARNRNNQLEEFKRKFNTNIDASQSVFYHLQFSNIEDIVLRRKLYEIKTSFNIEPEGQKAIDSAVQHRLIAENPCLIAIKTIAESRQALRR